VKDFVLLRYDAASIDNQNMEPIDTATYPRWTEFLYCYLLYVWVNHPTPQKKLKIELPQNVTLWPGAVDRVYVHSNSMAPDRHVLITDRFFPGVSNKRFSPFTCLLSAAKVRVRVWHHVWIVRCAFILLRHMSVPVFHTSQFNNAAYCKTILE